MEILNRYTGAVLYKDSAETMRQSVENALEIGADLRSADLEGANLEGADLRSADLRSADLRSADLRSADLRSADLRSAKLEGANLEGANLEGADLEGADLPVLAQIEKIEMRSLICARVCEAPERFDMKKWHSPCGTVHCIGGWTVTEHPQGKLLESIYGTSTAAALILWVCEGEIPNFLADNKEGMQWIKGEISYKPVEKTQ